MFFWVAEIELLNCLMVKLFNGRVKSFSNFKSIILNDLRLQVLSCLHIFTMNLFSKEKKNFQSAEW